MLRSALRIAALVVAGVIGEVAATGWLYWARKDVTKWPGPRIAALPLDELAHHATVPIVAFIAVVASTACLLGLVARVLAADRLTAALVLGASSGAGAYLHVAAAYYVVRQIPMTPSLTEAAGSPAIYLSACLIALGGALLGRPRRIGSAITALAAAGVAVAGVLDIVAAFSPVSQTDLMSLAPSVLLPVASAIDLPVGLLLVVSSRGLSRRNRNAWRIAVALLALSSLAHLALFHAEYGYATVTLALAAVLLARRAQYDAASDPAALSNVLVKTAWVVALTLGIAITGILVNDVASDLPIRIGRALFEAVRALAAQPLDDRAYSATAFATWFPWSIACCLALGVLWAFVPFVRPWRPRFHRDNEEHELARTIIRHEGRDSLAPFALRCDKSLYLWPEAPARSPEVVIAYRVVRGVALVSGAPIGPEAARREAMESFALWARRRGWSVAILGVAEGDLELYGSLGFVSVYHGNEAYIEVDRFSLAGGKMKAVRQAVGRVERQGYETVVLSAGELTPQSRTEIAELERRWLNGNHKKGFAMELDDLFRLGGDDAVFVLGRDREGRLAGLLHLVSCPASDTLSLSSMPRLADLPNGFTSWLIVRAVEWSALNGVRSLSLNFSPLAELFDAPAGLSPLRRVERRALLRLKSALSLQLDNLLMFNRQFCPAFARRFLVLERWSDLPRVVIAAMSVEGYLPFSERLRGWPAAYSGHDGASETPSANDEGDRAPPATSRVPNHLPTGIPR
jgi:lysyl-tRNA synthetase class 2